MNTQQTPETQQCVSGVCCVFGWQLSYIVETKIGGQEGVFLMRTAVKRVVVLVAFYNKKALGVRYLEAALTRAGYVVKTVFYKDFNSVRPRPTTDAELELLCREIQECRPVFVGLSVMSSMYLETVYKVMEAITEDDLAPILCGGAYATMFPEQMLDHGARFVIRADGERAVCRLADALANHQPYQDIPSLCFQDGGEVRCNEIGDILNDVDGYGIPVINSKGACYIEDDKLTWGDPQLNTRSYEVIASRGCPFTCSYCCCVNLRRILPKGIHGVRTRSVHSVIEELKEAKRQCRKIVFVHFYDEIFPNLPGWVDEFIKEYDKHIRLPFTIWSHPKMVELEMLKKLKKVGLTEVIMGIQSGSERVRRDVFHRYETQEDIINAITAIQKAGVFWGCFDLMLQHPFETIEDLKESYYLVKRFPGQYELQLHGLNFLPGTDIVDMAIQQGFYTPEEMDRVMYASMDDQFGAYWKRETTLESQLWYKMIYCYQFTILKGRIVKCEKNPIAQKEKIDHCYSLAMMFSRLQYLYKKGRIFLLQKIM